LSESERSLGDDTKEMNVAAYLELLNRRFTGAGPHGLYLGQDKALAKKIFSFHGIRTPFFATVYRGRLDWADDIKFPVTLKPGLEDGSIGIGFSAVVSTIKDLMGWIDVLQSEFDAPVLIEEYIEGREIYVGVIGNEHAQALPIVELDLSPVPDGTPKIGGTEVKWERGTRLFRATRPFCSGDLDEKLAEELERTAITAFHAFEAQGLWQDRRQVDARGRSACYRGKSQPLVAAGSGVCVGGEGSRDKLRGADNADRRACHGALRRLWLGGLRRGRNAGAGFDKLTFWS